jgi:hypothetical protein
MKRLKSAKQLRQLKCYQMLPNVAYTRNLFFDYLRTVKREIRVKMNLAAPWRIRVTYL